MQMLKDVKSGLFENFKASLRWASVKMIAAWGGVWVIYSQLPPDAMVWLAQWKVPMWMGIAQAIMTYLARVKSPKGGT